MARKSEVAIYVILLVIMILTINTNYITGYTAPIIDLSKNMCRGYLYLDSVQPYYTDVIETRDKYAFAGPIGVPLLLSLVECFVDGLKNSLIAGGLVMSISVLISTIFIRSYLIEYITRDERFVNTAVLLGVLASLPWVYSSHIFPQAVLTMCYAALLYLSTRLILSRNIDLAIVSLHSLFSSIAFLSDPSSVTLVIAVSLAVLVKEVLMLRKIGKRMLLASIASWLGIFSIFTSFQLYYNYTATGDPLLYPEIVYSRIRGLGTGFDLSYMPVALFVQLIDFRKSLLSLYPLSFIALVSIPVVLERLRDSFSRYLYLIMILTPLLVYSSWHDFHGGLAYGPRFLTPITIILTPSLLLLLQSQSRALSHLVLATGLYSVAENSIVLISTPYPCALQDLEPLENQFFRCSLHEFTSGSRSALITDLIYPLFKNPLLTNILSLVIIFSLASSLILLSYARKL
ncbi:MAG: hypothetical protein ABWJ42_01980 [Sulfolobales archaeon]